MIDELIRPGEFDAADAFAKAAPRLEVEKLPTYAVSGRGKPDDPAARKSLAEAYAARDARNLRGALEAFGSADAASPSDEAGIRRAFGRRLALQALNRLEEGAAASLVAATAAERLRWRRRASLALRQGGRSAWTRSGYRGALASSERSAGICQPRGDRRGPARTPMNIDNVYTSLGTARRRPSTSIARRARRRS